MKASSRFFIGILNIIIKKELSRLLYSHPMMLLLHRGQQKMAIAHVQPKITSHQNHTLHTDTPIRYISFHFISIFGSSLFPNVHFQSFASFVLVSLAFNICRLGILSRARVMNTAKKTTTEKNVKTYESKHKKCTKRNRRWSKVNKSEFHDFIARFLRCIILIDEIDAMRTDNEDDDDDNIVGIEMPMHPVSAQHYWICTVHVLSACQSYSLYFHYDMKIWKVLNSEIHVISSCIRRTDLWASGWASARGWQRLIQYAEPVIFCECGLSHSIRDMRVCFFSLSLLSCI